MEEITVKDTNLEEVASQIKEIIKEALVQSRLVLVEGYHQVGGLIMALPSRYSAVQDLARLTGISGRTLYYAAQFYEKYPNPDTIPEGKNITWNKVITKYLPKPEEIELPEGITLPDSVNIINDDFRKVAIDEGTVDLIITDPPYPGEFLPLWQDLGEFAARVLKPSGFLIAYSGQLHLPEVMELLNKNITYYWTFCLYHEGPTQLIMPRNLLCRWKPILIYQKPPYKKLDVVLQDYVISEKREKEDHQWQQSESGVKKLIENFSRPGDILVDPFSGAGTFPMVAHELKRRATGIEIDEQTYKLSVKRIHDKGQV